MLDNKKGISKLFALIIKKMENRLGLIKKDINIVIERDGYSEARKFIEKAEELSSLINELEKVSQRYGDLLNDLKVHSSDKNTPSPEDFEKTRLPKGLKTPDEAYRLPILKALITMGGRGECNEILDLVHEIMADQLNEYDYQKLSSGKIRWRNTARWERNNMRENGLLLDDSPIGIWEISQKGREYFRSNS